MMENGTQFKRVVFEYLKAVPDCEFYAQYGCTFDNCGAGVDTTYIYKNKTLKIVDKYSEDAYIDYCSECDSELYDNENSSNSVPYRLEDWEENTEYKCPNCGANIEWEVHITKTTFKIIDNELVEIKE